MQDVFSLTALVHSGGTEAEKTIYANKEIILSAGAIKSPQLLQLSGAACPKLHQNFFQGLTQINSLKTCFVEENFPGMHCVSDNHLLNSEREDSQLIYHLRGT